MPTHIFLSFAKADSDKIQSLKEHLATLVRNQEIILYSPNDYLAGTNTETQIQEDLAKSHYFLACLSSKYNSNDNCQKEVEMAMQVLNDNAIIPLLLQNCNWEYAPFVGKKPVPKSEKFIYSQKGEYIDAYYTEVVENIKTLFAQTANKPPQNTETYINFNATLLDKNDNNMLIGRRADYERLITALSPNKPTNIRGIAGIGKTTLVNFYLSQNETQKRFPTVHRIILADSRLENKFDESITEDTDYQMNTLYEALFLYFLDKIKFEDANNETKLKMIQQFLIQNKKNTLLVLDNADSYENIDRRLRFLSKTNCTILITSRNHIEETTEVAIEKVPFNAAKTMFAAYNTTPYLPEKIESLLQNIDCHTLLIELCAKQLAKGANVTIEELITAAAQYDFSVLTASHIVLSDYTYIETALDKFILYLFRPDTLTKNEQQVLRYFSLLRNIEYHLDKLVEWFTNNDDIPFTENIIKNLKSLSKQGWLQAQETLQDTKTITTYQCHLIVSYAIRKLLVPTTDNCIAFLENIKKEGTYHKTEHIIERVQYLPELLQIITLFLEEKIIIADILMSVSNFYNVINDYPQALAYNLKALNIFEKILGKKHSNTATTYNNIGEVYRAMGDNSQALIYYQKALNIFEKVFKKEHSNTATTYNNIGLIYYAISDYLQALVYYQQAINIHEKIFGKEHPSTAITYNNIAGVYYAMGDYSKALEYYQNSLSIYEKILEKKHPNIATTYNNIGEIYRAIGDDSQALIYYQKALNIFEKIFGQEHLNTTTIYNNIGLVYNNMSSYSQALIYYQQALNIYKKLLKQEHPDIAQLYNNIGLVYNNIEDYLEALVYYQQALSIQEKVLGQEHPNTAATYNNFAITYYYLQEYEKALEYIEFAIAIIENKLPETHPYKINWVETKERIKEKIKENEKK